MYQYVPSLYLNLNSEPCNAGFRLACQSVIWQSRRLQIGRILPAKRQTSVGRRLVRVARVIVPDWKWSVSVICVRAYLYITGTTSMYWSKKSFHENMWTDISLTLACEKCHWVCGTSIWWYPSIRILPPSPDKVHVVQLVYTRMY
jgi:hypothetical protein